MRKKFRSMLHLSNSSNLRTGLTISALAVCLPCFGADLVVQAYNGNSTTMGQQGVLVTLNRSTAKPTKANVLSTGSDGKCTFKGVPPGKYSLAFKKVGSTVIVPNTQANVGNTTHSEQVHVYVDGDTLDPQQIVWFLRSRAQGDSSRYAADVRALRAQRVLDDASMRVVAAGNSEHLPRAIAGSVFFASDTGELTVIPENSDTPITYRLTKRTRFVDTQGRPIPAAAVTPDTSARFTLGREGSRHVVTKITVTDASRLADFD